MSVQKPQILIVDDDDSLRDALTMCLEENFEHLEILEAENGVQALQLYEKNVQSLALILTDYKMPVMDGFQLLLEIRSRDREIPVIVVTGFENSMNSGIGLDQNTIVVSKPFDETVLVDTLKSIGLAKGVKRSHGVLLIDPSRTYQFILRNVLNADGGFTLTTASTAEDGVKLFERYKMDLVLTSQLFDGHTTGFEVAKAIRDLDPQVRLVLLSSHPDEISEDARAAGFSAWTSRSPEDTERLVSLLNSLVFKSRA